MNDDLLTEEMLFAGIEEKLRQLDGLSGTYGKIMSHIEREAWGEALDEAQKAGIDLFTDPQFSDETARYWGKVTHDADRLRERAQEAVAQAQLATKQVAGYAREMAVYMALLRGDEALKRGDVVRLSQELALVEGALPSWAVGWRDELRVVYEQLRQGGQPEQIVANDPYSRLAILQKRGKGVGNPAGGNLAHPPYIEKNLPTLSQHLQKGEIKEAKNFLIRLQNGLLKDKKIAPFQRMIYADMLTTWRWRIDQYLALGDMLKDAQSLAGQRPRKTEVELQMAQEKTLRMIESLQSHLDNAPPEILTCQYEGASLGMVWQNRYREVMAALQRVEKRIGAKTRNGSTAIDWSRRENNSTERVQKMQEYAKWREEGGRMVWQLYSMGEKRRPAAVDVRSDAPVPSRTNQPHSPATPPRQQDKMKPKLGTITIEPFQRRLKPEQRVQVKLFLTDAFQRNVRDGQVVRVRVKMQGSSDVSGGIIVNEQLGTLSQGTVTVAIEGGAGTFFYHVPRSYTPASPITFWARAEGFKDAQLTLPETR